MPFKVSANNIVHQVFGVTPGATLKTKHQPPRFGSGYMMNDEWRERVFYCGIEGRGPVPNVSWIYFKDQETGMVFVQQRIHVLNDPHNVQKSLDKS